MRQDAETLRARIRAEADIEIARAQAQGGTTAATSSARCEDDCYVRYPRKRTMRRRCLRRCRSSAGAIVAGLVAASMLGL